MLESAGAPRFAPTGPEPHLGHLVYGQNGTLVAAPFNSESLKVGTPVPVMEGLQGTGGLVFFGISRAGTLAFIGGPQGAGLVETSILTWVDRDGNEQPLQTPPDVYLFPRISPGGDRFAVTMLETAQAIDRSVWVYDLNRDTFSRLTFENGGSNPVWSPEGDRIYFGRLAGVSAATSRIYSTLSSGGGQEEPLFPNNGGLGWVPYSVSPDGVLVGQDFVQYQPWTVQLGPDGLATGEPGSFLDSRFTRQNFRFSPDGRWVAFQSDQSGQSEVYVVPFPGPGGLTQVSTNGGVFPVWNANGRELFYRSGDQMMAVKVDLSGEAFRAETPEFLFEHASPYSILIDTRAYDVHPDGNRFLMTKYDYAGSEADERQPALHVITNWFEQLREQVPLDEVE